MVSELAPVDVALAVDPGDRWVGWARWCCGVVTAGTWTPAECVAGVRQELARWVQTDRRGVLVIEEFVLYPNRAAAQAGSSFQTSQLIGALKLLASDAGVPVVMQGAYIKGPTRKQLRARR